MHPTTINTIRVTAFLLPALIAGCLAIPGGGGSRYRALIDSVPPQTVLVPVLGVKRSQLRDGWGSPRSGGRSHEGIDIFAKRGTPVVSATGGYVSRVGETNLGGQSVSVIGPGGLRHYYAHLDSYADKKAGDWVDAGDTLGFVGNTGNAQGGPTHLHYGIYASEGAINPYPFLAAKGAAKGVQPSSGSGAKSNAPRGKSSRSSTRKR